ncbi:Protein of unknown function [Gryllus bimaculatus]|nr:Protein of unknown function [Gryllus bimaculatus]
MRGREHAQRNACHRIEIQDTKDLRVVIQDVEPDAERSKRGKQISYRAGGYLDQRTHFKNHRNRKVLTSPEPYKHYHVYPACFEAWLMVVAILSETTVRIITGSWTTPWLHWSNPHRIPWKLQRVDVDEGRSWAICCRCDRCGRCRRCRCRCCRCTCRTRC